MNRERLQEIKDSISLQYKVQEANDLNNFNIFTDEEQELVEEIERLNNIINELKKENEQLQQQCKKQKEVVDKAVADYEKTRFEKEQLNSLVNSCQEEIRQLKKQFEVGEEQYNDLVEEKEKLQEQLSSNTLQLEKLKKQVNKGLYSVCLPYKTGYDKAIKDKEIQQKEFIKYLEDEFTKIQNDIEKEIDNNVKYFKVERRQAIAKILQKYKELKGSDNNVKD